MGTGFFWSRFLSSSSWMHSSPIPRSRSNRSSRLIAATAPARSSAAAAEEEEAPGAASGAGVESMAAAAAGAEEQRIRRGRARRRRRRGDGGGGGWVCVWQWDSGGFGVPRRQPGFCWGTGPRQRGPISSWAVFCFQKMAIAFDFSSALFLMRTTKII